MKILIVDDELSARKLLKCMLTSLFKEEKDMVLYEAKDLPNAVKLIKAEQPNIVLLDIEMPEHSGLEILEFLKNTPINFQLIFTTAYNDYAVEAFKLNATDYLLKPIDIVELENAIQKAKAMSTESLEQKLEDLRQTFLELKTTKIVLDVPNGFMFIAPDDVIALIADGMYTTVYQKDKSKTVIAKPIRHFIERLEKHKYFYRPHRSYYINLKYMKEFSRKDGATIILENGMSIPIARDKKEEFLYIIKGIF
ncbi:LytR/AlgR family response regulator transcription factor [Flavobacteriaceae bacterium M23B6Z8]